MRALILGLLLAITAVTPALAQAPPPVFIDFENQPVGTEDPSIDGARFGSPIQCPSQILGNDGHGGGRYFFTCGRVEITFASAQAQVAAFFRIQAATGPTLTVEARDGTGTVLDSETIPGARVNQWSPLVLEAPTGAPRITRVEATSSEGVLGVDDVGFSPLAQPDTLITAGPSDNAAGGDVTFSFTANGQPTTGFSCSIDGAAPVRCESPVTYTGLADGPHTFAVAAIDRWGAADRTPATRTWTVRKDSNGDGVPDALDLNGDGVPDALDLNGDGVPDALDLNGDGVPDALDLNGDGVLDAIDRDGDSVPETRDNCPDHSNPGQDDADRDGIGNACETLPSGTIPAAAGRRITVRLLFGEVFVRLPPGASSAFTTSVRVPFQDTGFVPLKGVATVPVDSVFDARRGGLAVDAALNAPPKGSVVRRRRARFRAGIFAVRQARAQRRSRRAIAARAVLVSPAGAERPCQASGPPKGTVVRSLTMTAGRRFRAIGGASRAVAIKGRPTITVTDRCDGTITTVRRGRGRVRVRVVGSHGGRRRVVRAGDEYRVRARLFVARKGRASST
jgi:hypothetical protein